MKKLSIREVRKELAQLDELVSREGEVVVTRCGRPIARVLRASQQATDAVTRGSARQHAAPEKWQ